MNYQEQIKKAVQEFYDVTKAYATSSHYTLSYWWVESNFGLDLNDEKVRSDVHEMSYSNGFQDLIQALDFDDIKKEVLVMIWEKGKGAKKMKKYTLENYEEFSREALVIPPMEEFEDGTIDEAKWYEDHKIRIRVDDHEIEIGYFAETVNEIEFALREMWEEEYGDGTSTTGNTVGGEYPSANWKDILKIAVLMIFERNDFNYKGAIKTVYKFFDEGHLREALMFAEKGYDELNHHFKVNFLNVETNGLHKIFDEQARYEALKSILCSDLHIEELYDKEGRCADKVMLTDYSIRPTGDFVGWHYGVDWDKDSEANQYYIQEYIKEMLK